MADGKAENVSLDNNLGKLSLEQNVAAVLYGVDDLRVEPYQVPMEKMGPKCALIQIQAVGICGSDVHYLRKGCCGGYVLEDPMVIGHESGGVVVDVGSDVTHLKVGDVVAMEPGVSCQECSFCLAGKYNLCPDMEFFATPPIHGSLSNYVVHPARLCFKIPDNLNVEHAALCEPLSIGVHACKRANIGEEKEISHMERVLVLGCGPIGFVVVCVCIALGVKDVVMTDFAESRIKFMKKSFGHQIHLHGIKIKGKSPEQVSHEVHGKLGGEAPDVVFDCAGFESSMATALEAVRSGGKVVLVGCGDNKMNLPLTSASQREVDILGLFRYRDTYPFALDLMSSGKVDVMRMITHRYGFTQEDVSTGFKVAGSGQDGAMKVMFRLDGKGPRGRVVDSKL